MLAHIILLKMEITLTKFLSKDWPLGTGKVSQKLTEGEENKLRRKTTSNDVELKLVDADVVEELQHHMIRSWMSYMKDF